jgi:hypothetical protein
MILVEVIMMQKSQLEAEEVVKTLRSDGNYARIICGYVQTKQK